MFELLRLLVETVVQGVPGLASYRRGKKRRNLAVELFLIYVRFNEILVNAEEILRLLERYLGADHYGRSDLEAELHNSLSWQGAALRGIHQVMKANSSPLVILEAEAYIKLRNMTDLKYGDLTKLGIALSLGRLPISRETSDIEAMFEPGYASEEVISQVRSYLESGEPQAQITEIRSNLEKLRAVLANNFSIEDVLIDVGTRRPPL
ncbi:hypothetical protein HRW07_02160 [Streptomyces lunaelactis]|uniref:hypothetical protein n=1 Tax=Streptomyces lunaelactis TaxID=1535768 RepID=UPI0015858647|nr:hypothetical protein [Streptomyces lunaelactis]NUL02070.1 hypothetical protein [Streptomyces lunaelactis]